MLPSVYNMVVVHMKCSSCGYLHKTKLVKNSRQVRVRATEAPPLAVEVL